MDFDFGNSATFFLVYTAVCCVVPMIVLAVGAVIAFRQGSSFVSDLIEPNVEKMQATYDQLRDKHPTKTTDDLVRLVIRRQAFRCGVLGAVTGLGGFVTLPIAMPVDMVMTYRIQATMVNFIAKAYNYDPKLMKEEQAVASLVMFGSRQVTQNGLKIATNLLLEVGGKFLAKLVPFIGALIGFALNFVTTQATGYIAAGTYSGAVAEGAVTGWRAIRARFMRDGTREETTSV